MADEFFLTVKNDWNINCRPDPNNSDQEICEMILRVSYGEKADVIVDRGSSAEEVISNVFSKAIKALTAEELNGKMPTLRTDHIGLSRKGAGHVRSYSASAIGPMNSQSHEIMSFSAEHVSLYKALMLALQKALAAQGIKIYLPFRK